SCPCRPLFDVDVEGHVLPDMPFAAIPRKLPLLYRTGLLVHGDVGIDIGLCDEGAVDVNVDVARLAGDKLVGGVKDLCSEVIGVLEAGGGHDARLDEEACL